MRDVLRPSRLRRGLLIVMGAIAVAVPLSQAALPVSAGLRAGTEKATVTKSLTRELSPSTNSPYPLVGAIRWDVWSGGSLGQEMELLMTPPQWHDRLPFYSTISDAGAVNIRLDSQATMDSEIAYAKAGSIDYWAFVYYGADITQLTSALDLYRSSAHTSDIKFSLILTTWAMQNGWPANVVDLAKSPQYQTVLGDRPLIYILADASYTKSNFDDLRSAMVASGTTNPYIVWMTGAVYDDTAFQFGLDAVSSYAQSGTGTIDVQYPYSVLSAANQQLWADMKGAGNKVVPLVSTGWDPRPIWANPPSYYPRAHTPYYATATPQEIGANLSSAINWVSANPYTAEPRTVIMYAWNEFAEGGSLDPTLDGGSGRLTAISQVMAQGVGRDIQPPTVSITAPTALAGISGTTTVAATATDNVGVAGVQFRVDGLDRGREDTQAPYSIGWDSTTASNGNHTVSAMVRDAAGNTSGAQVVQVTVSNAPTSKLLGNWTLSDVGGSITADTSGKNNRATLVGGATWTQGKNGSGIYLDGVSGYLDISDSSSLDGMKALTLSAWVNLSQLPSQNDILVGKDSNGQSYRFGVASDGRVSFVVGTTGNAWYSPGTVVTSRTVIQPGTWIHLVGTYDGSYLRIFVNGRMEKSGLVPISGAIVNSASALRLGAKPSANTDYTKGTLDEISLHSVALNQAEVLALYNAVAQNVDLTPPAVTMTQPADNAVVSGITSMSSGAADASGITKVEFYVDGTLLSADTSSPYAVSWDTKSYAHNTSHTLLAKAYDGVGNIGTSTLATVLVSDITPPVVSITSPLNRSYVTRGTTIAVSATASDKSPIARVEFSVNGSLTCVDPVPAYSCSWSIPQAKNIVYTLQARAFDIAGNSATAVSQVTSR